MKHLSHLDGIRAAAALFVLIYHAVRGPDVLGYPPDVTAFLSRWLVHGQLGVVVFIVLSGYCLMLPVAADPQGEIRGGGLRFFKRRFRRIYPAYLANLLFGILFLEAVRQLEMRKGGVPQAGGLSVGLWDVVSHLSMLHIFQIDTAFSINGVLWSVGTEWWIYVLFVALMVPIWRRWGTMTLVIVAVLLGNLAPLFGDPMTNLSWARPNYVGAFALGAGAAAINVSQRNSDRKWAERFPWHLATAGLFSILTIWYAMFGLTTSWTTDLTVAAATAALLGSLFVHPSSWLRKVLGGRFLGFVGACSYTLYLFHPFVLKVIQGLGLMYHLAYWKILIADVVIGIPVSLGVSHLLSLVLERPFLNAGRRTGIEPVKVAG